MPLMQWDYRFKRVTAAISTAAYGAGDVIGGLLQFWVENEKRGGYVTKLIVIDDDNVKPTGTLYLFHTLPATIADNAPFVGSVAELKKIIGKIGVSAGDWNTLTTNGIAIVELSPKIEYKVDSEYLNAYFITDSTPTLGTSGLDALSFALLVDAM